MLIIGLLLSDASTDLEKTWDMYLPGRFMQDSGMLFSSECKN